MFLQSLINRIPFYWELKVVGILWLTHPSTQGAYKLYNWIHPHFVKHERTISSTFEHVSSQAINRVGRALSSALIIPQDSSPSIKGLMNLVGQNQPQSEPEIQNLPSDLLTEFKQMLQGGSCFTLHSTSSMDHKELCEMYENEIERTVEVIFDLNCLLIFPCNSSDNHTWEMKDINFTISTNLVHLENIVENTFITIQVYFS